MPYTVFDVCERLPHQGWLVPAYTFPANREDLAALRIVVRNGFSHDLADTLVDDLSGHVDHPRNTYVTATVTGMAVARTGAEKYLASRLERSDYRAAYEQAQERIQHTDTVIRSLDARRMELDLTKAELARRAGVKPEAVRRLFSAERPNPTLRTLVALTEALGLDLQPRPRPERSPT